MVQKGPAFKRPIDLSVNASTGQVTVQYRDGDKDRTFNIYSSSKSYTSLAYGLILADWEGDRGAAPPLPAGAKKLTLDACMLLKRPRN